MSKGWVIVFGALTLGFALVLTAIHLPIEEREEILYHALRDLGIAFIVAAVVTAAFELHIRTRYQIDTIDKVFDITMRAIWNPEIWQAVRKHIFAKEIIRENFDLHLTFCPNIKSPVGRPAIEVRTIYHVRSLLHKPKTITIKASLDFHMGDKQYNLPRFVSVIIDKDKFDLTKPQEQGPVKLTTDGMLFITLENLLPNKENKPVKVEVVRNELVHVPGSYSLAMTEITKVACVHLINLPQELDASIYISTHLPEPVTLENNRPFSDVFGDSLLLPGQIIELRFKHNR